MGSLEERLRKLEETMVLVPSMDEYLDASNRERVRALHVLVERLAPYGFDGDHIFTGADRQMLAEDTAERRERDWETVEAWYRAPRQGPGRRGGRCERETVNESRSRQ